MTTLTIKRVAGKREVKDFNPAEYLKESRDWIIREILKYNSRSQLKAAMYAVMDAVQDCDTDLEADEKVLDIAMLMNFNRGDAYESALQRHNNLKRTVLS